MKQSRTSLQQGMLLLLVTSLALLALQCGPSLKPPQPYFEEGNYEAAVLQGESWLTAHPEDMNAMLVVAKAAYLMGDTTQAWEYFEGLLDTSLAGDERSMYINAAMHTGHLSHAKHMLLQEIRKGTGLENVNSRLANIESRIQEARFAEMNGDEHFAAQKWIQALQEYKKATIAYAGNDILQAKLLLTRAEMNVAGQGVEGAQRSYGMIEQAHALWPESALVWWVHGDVAWRVGDEDLARSSFELALDLDIGPPFRDKARMIVNSPDSF